MLGTRLQWRAVCAAAILMAAAGAQAQTPAYKCTSRGGAVTYSQVPCAAGVRPVNQRTPTATDKARQPPQDRARIARRAPLSPEQRQECYGLDGTLAEQERALKAKGADATLDDEMPLVRSKKRYRELRC